jgi:hypothetical protein
MTGSKSQMWESKSNMRGSWSGRRASLVEGGQRAGQALLVHYRLHAVSRIVLVKL